MNEGGHDDKEKLRVDLVPLELIEGVAKVLGFGAKKYGDYNWQKGIRYTRIYGSALRHIFQWRKLIDIDPESGLQHLEHAACNLAFLLWYMKNKPEFDDRVLTPPTPATASGFTLEQPGRSLEF